MKIETNNSQFLVNGNPVHGWKKAAAIFLVFALIALTLGVLVTFLLAFAAIIAVAFIPAAIYRLIKGEWPSWFLVVEKKKGVSNV